MLVSLQRRYRAAMHSGNVNAKQALYREAVYLGIQPALLHGGSDHTGGSGVTAS
jgi:hypothetical protein